jgi:hypothetical protein
VSDIPQQQEIGTSNEEDGITIGGPIPWFSVSLTIHADDLDPDEITRVLGVQPDQTQRKGVPPPLFGPFMLRVDHARWDQTPADLRELAMSASHPRALSGAL